MSNYDEDDDGDGLKCVKKVVVAKKYMESGICLIFDYITDVLLFSRIQNISEF